LFAGLTALSLVGVGFSLARRSMARTEGIKTNKSTKRITRRHKTKRPENATSPSRVRPDPGPPKPDPQDLETLARASGLTANNRVLLFANGKARVTTEAAARRLGYSIVDLSDNHAPFIFSEKTPGIDDYEKNDYRATYVNLANDRTDEEGNALGPDQHNYIELFGIAPSLSVLQKRFLSDAQKECYKKLDIKLLHSFRSVIRYKGHRNAGAIYRRYRELSKMLHRALRRTGLKSGAALAKRAKYRSLVRSYRRAQVRAAVINQTQLRLKCEGLLGQDEHAHRWYMDYVTHRALARFERKHMIFGWGQLYGKTLTYLGSPPKLNNYRALHRTLRERIADSLGIVEDGSVLGVRGLDPTYHVGDKTYKVRNLIGEYTKTLMTQMGLETPKSALAFFAAQQPALFAHCKVGVKLPDLPPYYSQHMKFLVEIDRGDVWYDFPYDAAGHRRSQPRSRLPHLVLFTQWKDQKIPLVRIATTIGGWRKEHTGGKVYLKYKNSDVGLKIWRDIVAAPVWIPPDSTPPHALVEKRKEHGRWTLRVKREEIGPSYLSAYGLVAAYHLQQLRDGPHALWRDNGIRTHGSVAYMSIFNGFSHGCHRLHNHLAVRLFSFLLRHSPFLRKGQVPLRYGRHFTYRGRTYNINLTTRGYYYTLKHPIHVMVTDGRIRGKVREPIEQYMPIPGIKYAADDPNLHEPQPGASDTGWSGPDSLPPDMPPADAQPIHPASPTMPKDAKGPTALSPKAHRSAAASTKIGAKRKTSAGKPPAGMRSGQLSSHRATKKTLGRKQPHTAGNHQTPPTHKAHSSHAPL